MSELADKAFELLKQIAEVRAELRTLRLKTIKETVEAVRAVRYSLNMPKRRLLNVAWSHYLFGYWYGNNVARVLGDIPDVSELMKELKIDFKGTYDRYSKTLTGQYDEFVATIGRLFAPDPVGVEAYKVEDIVPNSLKIYTAMKYHTGVATREVELAGDIVPTYGGWAATAAEKDYYIDAEGKRQEITVEYSKIMKDVKNEVICLINAILGELKRFRDGTTCSTVANFEYTLMNLTHYSAVLAIDEGEAVLGPGIRVVGPALVAVDDKMNIWPLDPMLYALLVSYTAEGKDVCSLDEKIELEEYEHREDGQLYIKLRVKKLPRWMEIYGYCLNLCPPTTYKYDYRFGYEIPNFIWIDYEKSKAGYCS